MLCPHCQAPNSDDARFCGACGRATSLTEPVSDPSLGEAPTLLGRVIAGRYRVLAKLGEGGMGAVFQAEQISLKRTVAIKLLRPDVSASPMLLRRFNAEAEAVAKLRHPNTVNIYDFGQDTDGTLFIAMELIEGRSLRSVVHREAPLPVRRALAIASQVAASLADAHGKTIVHRDLKPDNVMLTDRGRAKDNVTVLDFGIAKLRDESRATQQMTQAGDVLGTPQYMAPEQIRGEQIDGRTDVYALGCMIYEMITARLPFEAPSVMALLSKHLVEQAPPPSQRRPDLGIPPMVDDLVMGAMAKDPAARPPTMEDYGERIAAVLAALPPDQASQRSGVVGASAALAPVAHVDTPAAYSVPAAVPAADTPAAHSAPHADTPAGHSPPAFAPRTPPPPTSPPPLGFGPPGPPPGFGPPPGPPGAAPPGFGPPPGPPAAAPPPGFGPPPGPPGYAAHPAPYASGPGFPPPGPPPHASPFRPGPARTGGSSRLPWILVAVLALGGGGAGIYFATRGSSARSAADSHDDHDKPDPDRPDPDKPDPSKREPDRWDRKHDAGVPDPDDHDSDDSDSDDHDSDDTGSAASASSAAAGKTVDVGQGVKLIAPPGMRVSRQSGGVLIGDLTSYAIAAAPITERSNDPDVLARIYAKQSGLQLLKSESGLIAGAQRKVYAFGGMAGDIPVVHIGVPLLGRGYRVVVIVHLVGARATDEAALKETLTDVLGRRIIVPSANP